jgi:Rrf2 family protein
MIYSKSCQYGIRAILYLASMPAGKMCKIEAIARAEGIPQHFLAKVMGRLVKKRLIRSVKGVNGGFALRLPPEEITLFVIADAIDDISMSLQDCVFANKACNETQACPLHDSWVPVREQELQFLQSITIAQLL